MALSFRKAVKSDALLRMCLLSPAGYGKTYSALSIAKGFGLPIRLIDSERGSALKYADLFDFEHLDLADDQSPAAYIEALAIAARDFRGIVIVDGLSGAWSGKGGALEQVDRKAKASSSGSSFNAWRDVTPQHNALVDAMLACPCHLIATCRVKMGYELVENERGKKEPRRIGLQPIQRDGLEYEFDVVGDLTLDHELVITKTRCSAIADKAFPKPGENVARVLVEWLKGAPAKVETPPVSGPHDAALRAIGEVEPASASGYPAVPLAVRAAAKDVAAVAVRELPKEAIKVWRDEALGADFKRATTKGATALTLLAVHRKAIEVGVAHKVAGPSWALLVGACVAGALDTVLGADDGGWVAGEGEKAPETSGATS